MALSTLLVHRSVRFGRWSRRPLPSRQRVAGPSISGMAKSPLLLDLYTRPYDPFETLCHGLHERFRDGGNDGEERDRGELPPAR